MVTVAMIAGFTQEVAAISVSTICAGFVTSAEREKPKIKSTRRYKIYPRVKI